LVGVWRDDGEVGGDGQGMDDSHTQFKVNGDDGVVGLIDWIYIMDQDLALND